MTRMQEMSLHYHFSVEQEVGSSTHAFFGFNGIPVKSMFRFMNVSSHGYDVSEGLTMVKEERKGTTLHMLSSQSNVCVGTAGVWRISAMNEAGGWKDRTTVEDMDIAVRAHLNGWKFVFLNDVKVMHNTCDCF